MYIEEEGVQNDPNSSLDKLLYAKWRWATCVLKLVNFFRWQ